MERTQDYEHLRQVLIFLNTKVSKTLRISASRDLNISVRSLHKIRLQTDMSICMLESRP